MKAIDTIVATVAITVLTDVDIAILAIITMSLSYLI